ncbi:MAG: lipoprotein [Gammaproteobacteria bacterium]|nr:lipoprotein [Gammaproteobacteria bacterium]
MKTISRKSLLLIGLLSLSTLLSACGQKGPLRHPDPENQQIQGSAA